MENIKIDKNIPIPDRGKYSFVKELEVGDSFEIEKEKVNGIKNAAAYLKIKVVSRKVSGSHSRIWIKSKEGK